MKRGDGKRILLLQQEAIRLLIQEGEARLGMHKEESSISLNKNRMWRARERLDEASALLVNSEVEEVEDSTKKKA